MKHLEEYINESIGLIIGGTALLNLCMIPLIVKGVEKIDSKIRLNKNLKWSKDTIEKIDALLSKYDEDFKNPEKCPVLAEYLRTHEKNMTFKDININTLSARPGISIFNNKDLSKLQAYEIHKEIIKILSDEDYDLIKDYYNDLWY